MMFQSNEEYAIMYNALTTSFES